MRPLPQIAGSLQHLLQELLPTVIPAQLGHPVRLPLFPQQLLQRLPFIPHACGKQQELPCASAMKLLSKGRCGMAEKPTAPNSSLATRESNPRRDTLWPMSSSSRAVAISSLLSSGTFDLIFSFPSPNGFPSPQGVLVIATPLL